MENSKISFREHLYLSTIAEEAAVCAREWGLGLEIAEFCYAPNMDENFQEWDATARKNMAGVKRLVFHAPFAGLCAAAVDPLIQEVSRRRYEQAAQVMAGYGITRMVVHAGYIAEMYFPEFFIEHSVHFWRAFLRDKPENFGLLLENVGEDSPDILREIALGIDDPRCRICLDLGHAAVRKISSVPIPQWIDSLGPFLGHIHVHNNSGQRDEHNPPGDGIIDMAAALGQILRIQPQATFTLEVRVPRVALAWMEGQGFL